MLGIVLALILAFLLGAIGKFRHDAQQRQWRSQFGKRRMTVRPLPTWKKAVLGIAAVAGALIGLPLIPFLMAHDPTQEGPTTERGSPGGTGGGGGGGTYTNSTPLAVAHGGATVGMTFLAQTMQQMFDLILYPYQAPAFLTFLMTGVTILEVGDSISGNKTFTWTTSNAANINANSIDIDDITGSANLETGLANTGSRVHNFGTPITKSSATFNRFRIQGTNSHSALFNKTLDIFWQWMFYYGETTTTPLVEADIKALRVSGLQSGYAGTYVFTTGGYKYFAWPTALGAAASFKDASNNLSIDMQASYTVSVTNAFGVTTNYYVYRTTYILGGAITIIVA